MANYGFKGGNILNIDLYNRMVDLLNFTKKANIVLNTDTLSTNSGTNTQNEFSFYQQRSYLTLVTCYISDSTISTFYPAIVSSVDRAGASVTYTKISDTMETKTVSIEGVDYTLEIYKTKYSTSHVGDVWISADVISSAKDFNFPIMQFMAIQHENTETEAIKIERDDLSTYTNWSIIEAFLNSKEMVSYSMNVFNQAGTELGVSTLFWDLNDYFYINNMEGFTNAGITLSGLQISDIITSYTKGDHFTSKFGKPQINMLRDLQAGLSRGLHEPPALSNSMHVNFPIQRYIARTINSQDSLSSVDLYFFKAVINGYIKMTFDGSVIESDLARLTSATTNDFNQSTAIPAKVKPVIYSDRYFTIGTDIKIYFDLLNTLL